MVQVPYNQDRANEADSGSSKSLPNGKGVYQFVQARDWTNNNTGEVSYIFEFQSANGAQYTYWCNTQAQGFAGAKANQFYRMFCLASGVEDSLAAMSNFDTDSVNARDYEIDVSYAENKNNPDRPYVNVVNISPHNTTQQQPPQQHVQQQSPPPMQNYNDDWRRG